MDVFGLVMEDTFETVCLLLAVGKNIEVVPPLNIISEYLANEVEVLVQRWLRMCLKLDYSRTGLSRMCREVNVAESLYFVAEHSWFHQYLFLDERTRRRFAFLRAEGIVLDDCLITESFLIYTLYLVEEKRQVTQDEDSIFG